jgi:hypothetical protein
MKKIFKIILTLYNRIGRYGNERHKTDEGKKINEIYNKGWLLGFGAVFVNLVATLVLLLMLYTGIIPFERSQLVNYAIAYLGIEIAACLLMLIIFFINHFIFLGLSGMIIIVSVLYTYVVLTALFAGKDAGIHYTMFLYFPLSLIINTRYRIIKLVFLSFMIVVTLLTFYLTNIFEPLYPLPGIVIDVIYYIVMFSLITYSLVILYLTIWHLNYIDKILELWKKLTDRGNDHYKTERGIRGNRLSNQLFLFFISIGIFILIALTMIIIKAINIDYERYINYTILFYPAWLVSMCSLIGGYYFKNKLGKNLVFELSSMMVLASVFIFFTILAGSNSGIHFMLSTFFVLPFLGTTRYKLVKAGAAAFFLLIFLFMLNVPFAGIYPFPAAIERQIKNNVIFIVITSFVLSGVFTWVRFNVTARIVKLWDRLTERGFHLFTLESEKRLRKIQSSVMLIFLAATLFCVFIELGLIFHMYFVLKLDFAYVGSTVFFMVPPPRPWC